MEDVFLLQKARIAIKLTFSALNIAFPGYQWQAWKFDKIPNGLWEDMDYQREFLSCIAKEFDIINPQDWQKISVRTIKRSGGSGLLNYYDGSLTQGRSIIIKKVTY